MGLLWRSTRGPTYRAAWIQDTGELYLFQHVHTGDGSGTVHLVSGRFEAAELEALLDGWRDRVGRKGSLEWLLDAVTRRESGRTQPGSRPPARAPRRPSGSALDRNLRSGSIAGLLARTSHSAA